MRVFNDPFMCGFLTTPSCAGFERSFHVRVLNDPFMCGFWTIPSCAGFERSLHVRILNDPFMCGFLISKGSEFCDHWNFECWFFNVWYVLKRNVIDNWRWQTELILITDMPCYGSQSNGVIDTICGVIIVAPTTYKRTILFVMDILLFTIPWDGPIHLKCGFGKHKVTHAIYNVSEQALNLFVILLPYKLVHVCLYLREASVLLNLICKVIFTK